MHGTVQAEVKKRQLEESYNTTVTYLVNGGLEELKRFIEYNSYDYSDYFYGNTILHLLVQDLAFFQSNFGTFLTDDDVKEEEKIKIMQNKTDKIYYCLDNFGYNNALNKRQFTVICHLLNALPEFNKYKGKSTQAKKAETLLAEVIGKLLAYDKDTNYGEDYIKVIDLLNRKGYTLITKDMLTKQVKAAQSTIIAKLNPVFTPAYDVSERKTHFPKERDLIKQLREGRFTEIENFFTLSSQEAIDNFLSNEGVSIFKWALVNCPNVATLGFLVKKLMEQKSININKILNKNTLDSFLNFVVGMEHFGNYNHDFREVVINKFRLLLVLDKNYILKYMEENKDKHCITDNVYLDFNRAQQLFRATPLII